MVPISFGQGCFFFRTQFGDEFQLVTLFLSVMCNGSVAPHGLPDLILASSQFLVRISHENKRTMAAACGSLA
jgi:hypothetical protein